MMTPSGFDTRFSVVAIPDHPEMFMMNMQVFNVFPAPVEQSDLSDDASPDSMVWCAVFTLKGIKKV